MVMTGDVQPCDTLAVIVAAGSGSRFGAELPKQFCRLAGRPVLMHTVDAFRHAFPDVRILLVLSEDAKTLWCDLCSDCGFESPQVVTGGASRAESVARALEAAAPLTDDMVVMVHDGARPLAGADMLRRLRATVNIATPAVVPAVPLTDSLRRIGAAGRSEAVDRAQFRAVQTPQCFLGGMLARAYARAVQVGYERFTDDASVVEFADAGVISLVEGDPHNIKITTPGDLEIAAAIMQLRS